MVVTLREITRENWLQCVRLKVRDDQEGFVASNAYSLAEASYEPNCVPLAIYHDDTMVGFVMYAFDEEDHNYWVFRLMVDQEHQGKGYGGAAIKQVIKALRNSENCRKLRVSFDPDNHVARHLYLGMGFQKTGLVIWDEEIVELVF